MLDLYSPMKFLIVWIFLLLSACASTPEFTATVYEDPEWIVRLQRLPGANQGQGYDHPAQIDEDTLEKALAGILARTGNPDPDKAYAPVFTEFERRRLASLLSRGLQDAQRFEVVTFVRIIPAGSWQERVTSGGVFVENGKLHFLLANLQVKRGRWQDIDEYQDVPIENTPLEPVEPLPVELTFHPQKALTDPGPAARDFHKRFGLSPWHIAIRYQML